MFYIIIFRAMLGASIEDFKPEASGGPIPTLGQCYLTGEISLRMLHEKYPQYEFRAACSEDSSLVRHPNQAIYDEDTMAILAEIPVRNQ